MNQLSKKAKPMLMQPGMLQSMELQRVRQDLLTEQQHMISRYSITGSEF